MAAAVERIMSVFVIKDASKADLPLIAMTAEFWVQTQTAAVQILQPTCELHITIHTLSTFSSSSSSLFHEFCFI